MYTTSGFDPCFTLEDEELDLSRIIANFPHLQFTRLQFSHLQLPHLQLRTPMGGVVRVPRLVPVGIPDKDGCLPECSNGSRSSYSG